MNSLRFPISSISNRGHVFETFPLIEDVQPPQTPGVPVTEIKVKGRIDVVGREYHVRGEISAVFTEGCYRCLEPVRIPIVCDVFWIFKEQQTNFFLEVSHIEDIEEGKIWARWIEKTLQETFAGPEIDLSPYVWEELVFALPSRFLCKENCLGLCPRCGASLNHERCTCSQADNEVKNSHHGLAALAQLFPELVDKKHL